MATMTSKVVARKLLDTMPALWHVIGKAIRDSTGDDPNTIAQTHTLRLLYDAPRTFKELLAFRKVAPPTLSRTIEAMVQRGWVERVPHPTDRRQVLLSLTESGRSEVKAMEAHVESLLAQYIERASPQERQSLTTALDILSHMFQDIQCPPDAAAKTVTATKAARQRNNAIRAPKQRSKA